MKILLIGGTGNISAACARLALDRGMEVSILNRGQRSLDDYIARPGARSIVADAQDAQSMRDALGDQTFDVVANFIAFTPHDIERDLEVFRSRARQYFFISSASAYEKPLRHPFITESTPLRNPFWEYSRNKIACEERLFRAYREDGFPVVVVRPSLTYDTVWPVAIGGWDDFTLVDRIRRGGACVVHGDGTSLWTVTHSDDFAKGFVGLLGNTNATGHAFHITSDEVLTWSQIYRTIAEAAGVPEAPQVCIPSGFLAGLNEWERGNLLGDKAHSGLFDNTKIKQFVPGFRATIPFHEGIRRTLAWFEADPRRQRIVPAVNETMDGYISAWEGACAAARISR